MTQNGDYSSVNWYEPLQKLEEFCKERGWIVEYTTGKIDQALPDKNTISLSSRHKPEILFYFFLHELGHMLICDEPDYEERYKVLSERSKWTQTYRIGCVEEELEAWNRGFELAKSLELEMDVSKFEELKASKVSSYMMWAVIRKHPHPNWSKKKKIEEFDEDEE